MRSKRVPNGTGNPIPNNRPAQGDLPPAVRDLADLLADIASRQLLRTPSALDGQEKIHE